MHKWSDFWVFNGENLKKEKNTRFVHLVLIVAKSVVQRCKKFSTFQSSLSSSLAKSSYGWLPLQHITKLRKKNTDPHHDLPKLNHLLWTHLNNLPSVAIPGLLDINWNGISYQVYTYVDWPKQLAGTCLPKEVPSTSGIIGGNTGYK